MPNIGDSDDDWAELARELSRDKPQPLSDQPTPAEQMGVFGESPESTPLLDEEGDELPEAAGETEAEGAPDGQPGTGRKRRRRRRRRRRGGADQQGDATVAAAAEGEESEAGESTEEELESSEVGYSDEEEADSDLAPVEVDSEEDAGEELLRDLIANWNVPSWDDVVGGLYRPER
jgi:hypothetical protein